MRIVVAGALLAGPTALAFASGGYFDRPRTIAGLAAWALAALLAVTGATLPRGRAALAAIAGLAGLTVWAAISLSWAPLAEPARDDVGRLVAYLGVLVASAMAWRRRGDLRLIEPALAAGALVVALYGLSERLLPGLLDFEESATATGRLEQPLTYWNAMGAIAAFGLTLAIRLAGTTDRPRALRAAAAASAAPLGMAIYLTFSRGAIAALVIGVAAVIALSPAWQQVRAALVVVAAAVGAALVAALVPGLTSTHGAAGDGALGLAALLALAGAAAVAQLRGEGRPGPAVAAPPRVVAIGIALALVVGGPLVAVSADRQTAETGATASRLDDLGSNRYEYWDVALDAWADDPLRGSGIAGFRVDWLRERDIEEPVRDAHSLYLETAAELGLVGLLLLAFFVGGVAAAARGAVRRERQLAVGPVAALTVLGVHAAIDWDWEMPAVALPALVLAGALICRAGLRTADGRTG